MNETLYHLLKPCPLAHQPKKVIILCGKTNNEPNLHGIPLADWAIVCGLTAKHRHTHVGENNKHAWLRQHFVHYTDWIKLCFIAHEIRTWKAWRKLQRNEININWKHDLDMRRHNWTNQTFLYTIFMLRVTFILYLLGVKRCSACQNESHPRKWSSNGSHNYQIYWLYQGRKQYVII